jgi:hypothetical protein
MSRVHINCNVDVFIVFVINHPKCVNYTPERFLGVCKLLFRGLNPHTKDSQLWCFSGRNTNA